MSLRGLYQEQIPADPSNGSSTNDDEVEDNTMEEEEEEELTYPLVDGETMNAPLARPPPSSRNNTRLLRDIEAQRLKQRCVAQALNNNFFQSCLHEK